MFKNIDDCLSWVMKRKGKGNLSNFKKIMNLLNNPQDTFKSIHIAGTNGKGSTIAYLKKALVNSGFMVGSFQSPHFQTHLDRIRINENNISAEFFLKSVNNYYQLIVDYNLNMFEIDFMIMACYFKDLKVDYALIEVGLGGRFDSTNCLKKPLITVITNISLDHIELLGSSIYQIAYEKAGIIKQDGIVISFCRNDIVDRIILNCAHFKNNQFIKIDEFNKLNNSYKINDVLFEVKNDVAYQLDNSFLALKILEVIAKIDNFKIDYKHISQVFKEVLWKGRFQILKENPRVIIDGAHNEAGIKALISSIKDNDVAFIFSAMMDKDYLKMLNILKKNAKKIYLTSFENERNFKLKNFKNSSIIKIEKDYKQAYLEAIKKYKTIIFCGSLYFISEVYKYLKGEKDV